MREDIIRMAREAGFTPQRDEWLFTEMLERFADLVNAKATARERERIIAANAPEIERVNAHIKELENAVKAEREACAKVCEDDFGNGALNLAAAIRARGQS